MLDEGTFEDFAAKVQWEGGIEEGMLYFGHTLPDRYDIPYEFRKKWEKAYMLLRELKAELPNV